MTGRSRGSKECANRPFTRSKFQYFSIISIYVSSYGLPASSGLSLILFKLQLQPIMGVCSPFTSRWTGDQNISANIPGRGAGSLPK